MNEIYDLDLRDLEKQGYQVTFHSHARAIIAVDFPKAWDELETSLLELTIPIEEIVGSGGGEAKGTQRLRRSLAVKGWQKEIFHIEKRINDVPKESQSHEIDHVRRFENGQVIALEIEWNNKDPFFDRDLENFKRLHAEGAISLGIVVTRGETLQNNMRDLVNRFAKENNVGTFGDLDPFGVTPTKRQRDAVEQRMQKNQVSFANAWTDHFVSDKFGAATTHWRKLNDRVLRGVGNPCPLVLIGLPDSIVTFGESASALAEVLESDQNEA